jgi:GTPase SAR1 family protein
MKKIQILTLGDGSVGKTSILRWYSKNFHCITPDRYHEGKFTTTHMTTIGYLITLFYNFHIELTLSQRI